MLCFSALIWCPHQMLCGNHIIFFTSPANIKLGAPFPTLKMLQTWKKSSCSYTIWYYIFLLPKDNNMATYVSLKFFRWVPPSPFPHPPTKKKKKTFIIKRKESFITFLISCTFIVNIMKYWTKKKINFGYGENCLLEMLTSNNSCFFIKFQLNQLILAFFFGFYFIWYRLQ